MVSRKERKCAREKKKLLKKLPMPRKWKNELFKDRNGPFSKANWKAKTIKEQQAYIDDSQLKPNQYLSLCYTQFSVPEIWQSLPDDGTIIIYCS